MRNILIVLLLAGACKGEANRAPAQPTDQVPEAQTATTSAEVTDASVATAHNDLPPDAGQAPSWNDLILATKELKTTWQSLPKNQRMAFYRKWAATAHQLSETLREEGDGDLLTKWVAEGTLSASVRASGDEGYYYALYVSEAWLLKTFPTLDADERAFLSWKIGMDQDEWFAEGDLQVSVNNISDAYKGGMRLLKAHPKAARETDIKNELKSIVIQIASLLWQSPPPYQNAKFQRDVKKAFKTLASSKLHKNVGEGFLLKFPVKGIPYDNDKVEALLSTLGVTD